MPDGEFFALDPRLVDAAFVEDGPSGRVPYVEANVGPELAWLGEILGVDSSGDLLDRFEQDARRAEHGQAWLVRLPTELRDALGTLETVDAVAERWAATEELADWSTEVVRELVLELRDLAAGAKRDGAELWLWTSL